MGKTSNLEFLFFILNVSVMYNLCLVFFNFFFCFVLKYMKYTCHMKCAT